MAFTIGAMLAFGLAGCKEDAPKEAKPRLVRVLKADPQQQFLAAEASGQVTARYTSNVGFLVAGRLVSRNVDVGAAVKAGDLLARIDATDLENRAAAAQAQVAAAQANVDQAGPQEER